MGQFPAPLDLFPFLLNANGSGTQRRERLLVVDNLSIGYPGQPHFALNCLSLTLDGSACILGPSGAGKSTLLRTLIGLTQPRSGRIRLEGVDIAQRPLRARRLMAYVPQDNALPQESTLAEYLEELATLDGYLANERRRVVDDVLSQVHLSQVVNHRLRWLSGGMKRRALLAGALLRQTPWLLLDEPTMGLDPQEQASVRALIRRLSCQRRVLVASQFVDDAGAVPERVIILNEGQIAADTTWNELSTVARQHVYSVPPTALQSSQALWAPQAGSSEIKLFAPVLEGLPLDPSPEDGYLWLLHNREDRNP
jgi:ABC-2 type transport system ATP-binding protein